MQPLSFQSKNSFNQKVKLALLILSGTVCIGVPALSFADDLDIFTVGPTTNNTLFVYDSYYKYSTNQFDRIANLKAGSFSENLNTLTLAASYAVTQDLNVFASLSDRTTETTTNIWYGNQTDASHSGKVGNSVGASYRVWGTASVAGTSLFGTLQTGNSGTGVGQWVDGTINPQYRFSD